MTFDSVMRWFRTKKHVRIDNGIRIITGYIMSISHEGGENIYILKMSTEQGMQEICVRLKY